jgi:hypothetical protein
MVQIPPNKGLIHGFQLQKKKPGKLPGFFSSVLRIADRG